MRWQIHPIEEPLAFSRSDVAVFGTRISRRGRMFFCPFKQESVLSVGSAYKKRRLSSDIPKIILRRPKPAQSGNVTPVENKKGSLFDCPYGAF
jgi:hypothetical protein